MVRAVPGGLQPSGIVSSNTVFGVGIPHHPLAPERASVQVVGDLGSPLLAFPFVRPSAETRIGLMNLSAVLNATFLTTAILLAEESRNAKIDGYLGI